MPRVLLLATTTGYQTRSFGDAAESMGVELVFATDRCHQLDDPWRDSAIPIRFHDEDSSLRAIVTAAESRPIDGVLALGDRPTVIAARAAASLGLRANPPAAAAIARNKLATRQALTRAGLPAPWFRALPLSADPTVAARGVSYPCVLKPLALAASRGVMRADDETQFVGAFSRLRGLLGQREIRALRDEANDALMVEGFVPGDELAVEAVIEDGKLRPLAVFDKPDPLDGPFFEETIYITPSRLSDRRRSDLETAVARAAAAIGLCHGPIHAECRVSGDTVVVLEVAARPIGGLCARALRFVSPEGRILPLEELLLRHALGEPSAAYTRETSASGVMMVPIPRGGMYRGVEGTGEALDVPGISEVRITAKPDQRLVPLPEGGSYLGFIFARGETPQDVEEALRAAHARLGFIIDPWLEMKNS